VARKKFEEKNQFCGLEIEREGENQTISLLMITLELVAAAGAVKQIEIREIEADLCTTQRKKEVLTNFSMKALFLINSPFLLSRKENQKNSPRSQEKRKKEKFISCQIAVDCSP
jgi:hypothetical protein